MATKMQEMKWKLYTYKQNQLLIYGLKNGLIQLYDDELIKKLRTIYYGGIPASIMLLSKGMTNGHCYERALLMSRAFLDEDGDVQLLYASVDNLRLNPKFISDDPLYADHCIVERITPDGKHLIYDTTDGLIYDKDLYWLIERPQIRKRNSKEDIKRFIEKDETRVDIEKDKYVAPLIIPMIEATYGRDTEIYSQPGIEFLQREIEIYKNMINYDELVKEVDQDMRRLGLKN